MTFISERGSQVIDRARRRSQVTKELRWLDDSYECWTVNRDSGWPDGTSVEAQTRVESGVCKLYANGAGGPTTGDTVISLESPYRLRMLTSANVNAGNLVVLNSDRLFRVDVTKPEDGKDWLQNVFVTELFNTPKPVTAPPVPEVP